MSPVSQYVFDGSRWVNEVTSTRRVATAVGPVRDATLQPFTSGSPLNTSLGSEARYADDQMAATLRLKDAAIASARWSIAIVQAKPSDPLCDLELPWGVQQLHIPVDAMPAAGTDGHLSVMQPDGRTVVETWGMTKLSSTRWKSGYAVTSDMLGTGLVNGAKASGISQLNGLIRSFEISQLDIPHALSIAIDNTQLRSVGPNSAGNYGVWPARRQDGDGTSVYSGSIPMGTMFALRPTIDLNGLGLSREGYALGRCLRDFGVYVLIRGGTVSLHAEPALERDNPTGIANMRRDFINKLRPNLVHVTNSTEATVAGGGTRRRLVAGGVVAAPSSG